MFKKIFDEKFDNTFIKGYKIDEKYTILDVIKIFQNSNIVINNVYVNEDADLGFKTFEGNYSLDNFIIKYDKIQKDIESIILDIGNNIRIRVSKNNWVSILSDENIEIDELFTEQKKL